MTTHVLSNERSRFFHDEDGLLSVTKEDDATESVTIDWSERLDSGETISSSAWTLDGLTQIAASNTTTATTLRFNGGPGEAKNTVVTSAARTLIERVRVKSAVPEVSSDYR